MAMMRQHLIQGAPRRTVMLNGSSYMDELGYRDVLESWERDGDYPVTYVPTISRAGDARNAGWTGRTGRAEGVILDVCRDLELEPQGTVVYICGNPDMIINVEDLLLHAGYPEENIKKELYWPKGKTVTASDIRAAQAGIAATAS
jgi:NAD(P)H-flavin reductase